MSYVVGQLSPRVTLPGHVFTVWRAEVNTRIHVRIQLQSKYVEYELPIYRGSFSLDWI